MIFKESVNNSIKYADCRQIELKITLENKKLSFAIIDDGKGFDKGATREGNGLKNISSRSKEINYTATINSSPGNGTRISLQKN